MAKSRLAEKAVLGKSWATITHEQLRVGENVAVTWGVTRRCANAILTRTGPELFKDAKDPGQAEAFLDVAKSIAKYMEWRKTETELLEAARARLILVLSKAYPAANRRCPP
jgi:hypothetical protein